MARFNKKQTPPTHVTHEGGRTYAYDPMVELPVVLATTLFKGSFYEGSADDQLVARIERIRDLLDAVPLRHALNSVLWARHVHGNRSSTHVAAWLLAPKLSGSVLGRMFYRKVVKRPDDMTEIIALFLNNGHKVPNAVKRGFADAFAKFDAYQLAKYRKAGHAVSLIDVVRLVHPRDEDGRIGKLLRGELRPADTWEVGLSTGQDKTETFKRLIREGKLGYLAMIRNVRNIEGVADDELRAMLEEAITSEAHIRRSMVWPHQVYQAYLMAYYDRTRDALARAVELAMGNVQVFEGKRVCVVVDESGSMSARFAGDLSMFDVAAIMGLAMAIRNGADMILFSYEARYFTYDNRGICKAMRDIEPYYGSTNLDAAFKCMRRPYDVIIVFSDMQLHNDIVHSYALKEYRRKYGVNPAIIAFDLAGYGGTVAKDNVLQFGGFTPELLQVADDLQSNMLIESVQRAGGF